MRVKRMPIPAAPGPRGPAAAAASTSARRRARRDLDQILAAAGLAHMDASEAVFLVMTGAAKEMDEDIRMILVEIRAVTAAKQQLRKLIKDLNSWISNEMSRGPAAEDIDNGRVSPRSPGGRFRATGGAIRYGEPWPDVASPGLVSTRRTTYRSGRGWPTIGGLRALLDELQGRLDGMNEMSEMTSLRLQMTMDRRSKFISTLSQMMKKISTTQDILVQNVK